MKNQLNHNQVNKKKSAQITEEYHHTNQSRIT